MTDPVTDSISDIKPTDLRGILKYVPMFQNQTFVISVDGRIVEDPQFNSLLLDIAVLRNLQIKVILVFGIGQPLRQLTESNGETASDIHGTGKVDDTTLKLATKAAGNVSHNIMQGLTKMGIKCAATNAVRATPVGIIKGENQLHLGKVDRVDTESLQQILSNHMVPLISPIAFDRNGESLRLDSDHLATEVAVSIAASKILFITSHSGLTIDGQFHRALETEQLRTLFRAHAEELDETIQRKCRHALQALDGGVSRVHILDGLEADSLLNEVFSSVGVGTLFYNHDYQKVRAARPADAQALFELTRESTENEVLEQRSLKQIEERIDSYFVYEIDGYILGCGSLVAYPDNQSFEIASLIVKKTQAGKGLGQKLVAFAEKQAASKGGTRLFALSTQTFRFFTQKCGFTEGGRENLPSSRADKLEASQRNSKVLVKELA
ncbi:amino-acid N-acetyltransferase [Opitutia bacterium ISCC 51]|nr:amino-acid N-acetyltransferase [Opitutae bacterium ISCC 51]QXD26488.1 amino-acid N-acetyltransferase [Opitutae bacterium ISCC 52]